MQHVSLLRDEKYSLTTGGTETNNSSLNSCTYFDFFLVGAFSAVMPVKKLVEAIFDSISVHVAFQTRHFPFLLWYKGNSIWMTWRPSSRALLTGSNIAGRHVGRHYELTLAHESCPYTDNLISPNICYDQYLYCRR